MAKATWDLINKTTNTSGDVREVSITGIPATYTDLFIVGLWAVSDNGANAMRMKFNGTSVSGTEYTNTHFYGAAGSSGSVTGANDPNFSTRGATGSSVIGKSLLIAQVQNYANTTDYKPYSVFAGNYDNSGVEFDVGVWSNTNAITSIQFRNTDTNDGTNFIKNGAVFWVYGIKAE
jgi:hypothetical protein